jgi:hypothetical protein
MPANNVIGSFEDSIEQGISQVSQHAKAQVASTAQSVATQTTGNTLVASTPPPTDNLPTPTDVQAVTDQFNETASQGAQKQTQDPQDVAKAQKEKEELERRDMYDRDKKLKDARQRLLQLHNQVYYDPTFNRKQKEPTVQEKLEQEEAQKQQKQMADLEEKKKKEPPIALRQAQTKAEMNRGASG